MKTAFSNLPTSTFACGPGQGHPEVRQAALYQALFERSHRAPDISTSGLYHTAEQELRKLLSIPPDYLLFFFPGGATPALDAITWSLSLDTISGLGFGSFSNRWCHGIVPQIPGIKAAIVSPQPGSLLPLEKPDTQASLILLTPNETSTGVQLPDEYLEDIWEKKGPNSLVAWDTTSCAGGRKLPSAAYDVQVFGLQKCFGAGGGTAAVILSPQAVARIAEVKKRRLIPYILDLSYAVENALKFQTVNTPSTINIWMCCQAAKWMNAHGGLAAMDALCRKHAQYLVDWSTQTDWIRPCVCEEQWRSYTTLTMDITDPRISEKALNQALAATGLPNLQDGIKKFSHITTNSVRISCFPFVDINGTEQYARLTALLDKIAEKLRAD